MLSEFIQKYRDFQFSNLSFHSSEDLKVYILINGSLKLSKGKIASQVGHAIQLLTENLGNSNIWKKYKHSGIAKITLQVPTEQEFIEILDETKDIFKVYVIDAGKTQCPENSLTCVAYIPLNKKEVPRCISNLKLLYKLPIDFIKTSSDIYKIPAYCTCKLLFFTI
jgi:PTH2 family peptidyl-tRNA hydrolase